VGRLINFPPIESRMRMFSLFKLLVIGLSVSRQIFWRCNLVSSLDRIRSRDRWRLFLVFVVFASRWGGCFQNELCLNSEVA